MTETELTDFVRDKAREFSSTYLAERCDLTVEGIRQFKVTQYRSTQLRTLVCLLRAMGYDLQVVRREPVVEVPPMNEAPVVDQLVVARPVIKRTVSPPTTRYRERKVKNEYACLKCGLDVGVVEVHGHFQCASCNHIIQDCCGD